MKMGEQDAQLLHGEYHVLPPKKKKIVDSDALYNFTAACDSSLLEMMCDLQCEP
jgi:hypothetical protein